jgi:hypothetical protein
VGRGEAWTKRIKPEAPSPLPKVIVAPIAAGTKVLASTKSSIYKFIRSHYNDAQAVEKEGLGFLSAAHANRDVKAVVIRGISDLVDDKDEDDVRGFQDSASRHAAAFAFELLANWNLGDISKKDQMEEEMKLLIAPLFAKFNKNVNILSFMSLYLISRIGTFPDRQDREELEILERDLEEIMRSYGWLAQSSLYSQIKAFLDLKPKYDQRKRSDAWNILNNISKLVKTRYEELRAELKSDSQ